MNIYISNEAAQWYENEFDLQEGDQVRFFARYGGVSTIQSGFSLGISVDEPNAIGAKIEKNNILYYIEENDLWYFDQHDLHVKFDTILEEPIFSFE
ncbi:MULTISPECIES: HesB/YadR/YfhF family protein [Bacillus]|uniref:HesB/YadR/YfhF family protein n=1 Tax=Bacillus TaxID=1386 RepID=UPI00030DF99F|nr:MULTISPECIES: HesB/YadR/YfhF family protein [Bacillus]